MGMFDTFRLKVPIQCRNCYTGSFHDFQTKNLECALDMYIEGEPAVAYAWREITEDEKKLRHERCMLLYPKLVDTVWEEMLGMFRSDKTKIIRKLGDGIYWTYTYCDNCETIFIVPMEVKGGIFVGVADV